MRYGYGYPAYGYGYGYPGYGYGYGKGYGYAPSVSPMAPATAIQLTATDMGPATAIQLTATDMGPATATRVTAMLITPLSDALSMPPLSASGVIGATEPGGAREEPAGLDAEEWRDLVGQLSRHRWSATWPRKLGDGLLALFGYPVAHENDPERAALAIQRALAELNRETSSRRSSATTKKWRCWTWPPCG